MRNNDIQTNEMSVDEDSVAMEGEIELEPVDSLSTYYEATNQDRPKKYAKYLGTKKSELLENFLPITKTPGVLERFLEETGLADSDLDDVNLSKEAIAQAVDKRQRLIRSVMRALRRGYWDTLGIKLFMFPWLSKENLHREDSGNIHSLTPKEYLLGVWPKSRTLLLQSPRALAIAYTYTDTYTSFISFTEKVLPTLFYSFTLNELINYLFVDGRTADQIRFIDIFNIVRGQSDKSKSISTLLGNPYVAPFILAAPFAYGLTMLSINYTSYRCSSTLITEGDVEEALGAFHNYSASFWQDFGRWLLPSHPIGKIQNRLENIFTWDGRVCAEQRMALAQAFFEFVPKARGLTQLKAMDVLMNIINGISILDFKRLKEAGYDSKTIAATLKIKLEAHRMLRQLADNYQLAEVNTPQRLKPLVRFLYANYLLWYIGRKAKWFIHPAAWGYEAYKFYGIITLSVTLIKALSQFIGQQIYKAQCLAEGRKWNYFNFLDDYNCTACPDFPIAYKDSFTPESCLEAYLFKRDINPTSPEYSIALSRFPSLAPMNFTFPYFTRTDSWDNDPYGADPFRYTLKVLSQRIKSVPALVLNHLASSKDIIAMANFLEKVNVLDLAMTLNSYNPDIMYQFSKMLANSKTLQALNLNIKNLLVNFGFNQTQNMMFVMDNQPKSIKKLILTINRDAANNNQVIKVLTDGLKKSTAEIFELYIWNPATNLYEGLNEECMTILSKALPQTAIKELITYNAAGDRGISIFANNTLANSRIEKFVLRASAWYQSRQGLIDIAQQLPYSKLKTLDLSFNPLDKNGLLAIGAALKNSPFISHINLSRCNLSGEQFKAFMPFLAQSNAKYLDLSFNALNDEDAILLADYLPPSLTHLDLNVNYITDVGVQALAPKLPRGLIYLGFQSNYYSSLGLMSLATHLPDTLQELNIRYNAIAVTPLRIRNTQGIRALADNLSRLSNLKVLYLDSTGLGDEEFSIFAEKLPGTALTHLSAFSNSGYGTPNQIGPQGAKNFAAYLPFTNLIDVRLDSNSINDEGAKAVAQILTTYQPSGNNRLWVTFNSKDETKVLTQSKPNTRLKRLNLAYNNLTAEGVTALCRVIPFTDIDISNYVSFIPSSFVQSKEIDPAIVNPYTCQIPALTSSANRLQPPWPFMLLHKTYRLAADWIGHSMQEFSAGSLPADVVSLQAEVNSEIGEEIFIEEASWLSSTFDLNSFKMAAFYIPLLLLIYRWCISEEELDYDQKLQEETHAFDEVYSEHPLGAVYVKTIKDLVLLTGDLDKGGQLLLESEFHHFRKKHQFHPYAGLYFKVMQEPSIITVQEIEEGLSMLTSREIKQLAKLSLLNKQQRKEKLNDLPDVLVEQISWLASEAYGFAIEQGIITVKKSITGVTQISPCCSFWLMPSSLPTQQGPEYLLPQDTTEEFDLGEAKRFGY